MPNRIPTPGIPTPQVRASKTAQPPAKPMPLGKGMSIGTQADANKAKAAETMFAKDMATGKVKNLDAERQKVANKTGAYPNGRTN
jgi:hypothetical protein